MAQPTKTISKVLIIFAMEAEATPFITRLGLKEDKPRVVAGPAPCITFSGMHAGVLVHVAWNGKCDVHGVDYVGTVPAALTAYLATAAFEPDLVISAGTAGGFKAKGAAIGDVYVSSATVNNDRRIPIPGFDRYGIGHVASVPTPNLQAALGIKSGIVSSGNSLDFTDKCMEIMSENNVGVKEMEGAGIAWVVCQLYRKPMFCIKAITDIVDGGRATQDEFLENLAAAAAALQSTLPKVIDFLAGKTLEQL